VLKGFDEHIAKCYGLVRERALKKVRKTEFQLKRVNKGALQYLPGGQKDEWPDRDEEIAMPQKEKPVENRKPTT
jgi:hypothetical protein